MYLNQKALWKPVVTEATANPYGDIIHSDIATEISVRRQEHVEEVRTKDGTIHHTNFIYYTHADVKIDDKLDGNLVVSLYDMNSLSGHRKLRKLKTI